MFQIPPVSICVQTDSRSTKRSYQTGSQHHAPNLLTHHGDSERRRKGAHIQRSSEPTITGAFDPMTARKEGRWCCGWRMKQSDVGLLPLVIIHTYDMPGWCCVHEPVVHFGCIHVNPETWLSKHISWILIFLKRIKRTNATSQNCSIHTLPVRLFPISQTVLLLSSNGSRAEENLCVEVVSMPLLWQHGRQKVTCPPWALPKRH